MARAGSVLLTVAVLLATGAARAEDPQSGPARAEEPRSGGYAGVTPEGGEPPAPKPPPPGFQYVTWPGFRVGASGSEVFLQLTGPVKYKDRRRGSRVYVTMEKTMVHLKDNLRPVLTRNFRKTPVSQFRLRKMKKDRLRLEISLRKRSRYKVTTRTAGQYHYLIVTFPAPR